MNLENCMLCGDTAKLDYIIICPLLNDPRLKVCLNCANNEKIRQNEAKTKCSIWNKND